MEEEGGPGEGLWQGVLEGSPLRALAIMFIRFKTTWQSCVRFSSTWARVQWATVIKRQQNMMASPE